MRDLYITVQGEEIPIVSYELVDGKIIVNDAYNDYQYDLVNMIARKFIDNYSRKIKGEIKEIIAEKSSCYKGCFALSNEKIIEFFVGKYLNLKNEIENAPIANEIKKIMINTIKEDLANDKLITLDYSEEVEADLEYVNVEQQLRKIMAVLRRDILDSKTEENAIIIGQKLKHIVHNYCEMKKSIVYKIVNGLKDTSDYKRNKTRAFGMVSSVVEKDLESYINLSNVITIDELLQEVPKEIIIKAADEYLNVKKYNYLSKLFSVINAICHTESAEKYSTEEKTRALLIRYRELIKDEEELVEIFLSGYQNESEELDDGYDMKGRHTFEPFYSTQEMDYYGHGEDPRIKK